MRTTHRGIGVVCVFTLGILAANTLGQDPPAGRPAEASRRAVELTTPSPVKARLPKLLQELVQARKGDEQVVEALYLAALTRLPTGPEAQQARRQVADGKDRVASLEKVLKGLTESPEFARLHPDPIPLKVLPLEHLPRGKPDPNAPGKGPFFNR